MREIKFRGYDTDSKVWRYGYYFLKEDTTLSPIYNSKEQYEKDKKENRHHLILFNGFSDWNLPKPHYQSEVDGDSIGQYTGLKDKDNKEIYEGDIVTDGNVYGAVVFDEKHAQFMIDDIYDEHQDYTDWWHEVKIIGNIYENADLLSGQK